MHPMEADVTLRKKRLTAIEMDTLIQDLMSSADHCPARDVIAAGLIANMRDALRSSSVRLKDMANYIDEVLGKP